MDPELREFLLSPVVTAPLLWLFGVLYYHGYDLFSLILTLVDALISFVVHVVTNLLYYLGVSLLVVIFSATFQAVRYILHFLAQVEELRKKHAELEGDLERRNADVVRIEFELQQEREQTQVSSRWQQRRSQVDEKELADVKRQMERKAKDYDQLQERVSDEQARSAGLQRQAQFWENKANGEIRRAEHEKRQAQSWENKANYETKRAEHDKSEAQSWENKANYETKRAEYEKREAQSWENKANYETKRAEHDKRKFRNCLRQYQAVLAERDAYARHYNETAQARQFLEKEVTAFRNHAGAAAEAAALRVEIQKLRSDLNVSKEEKNTLTATITTLNSDISTLQQWNREAATIATSLQAQVENLETSLKSANKTKDLMMSQGKKRLEDAEAWVKKKGDTLKREIDEAGKRLHAQAKAKITARDARIKQLEHEKNDITKGKEELRNQCMLETQKARRKAQEALEKEQKEKEKLQATIDSWF